MAATGDNPIESADEDLLGMRGPARAFASHVLSLDPSKGLVVAVLGPWGSGKTSFLNLAREVFAEREAVVLDFNPWMFSGADQLVSSFFAELGAQLKQWTGKFVNLGEAMQEYGDGLVGLGWLPFVGAWVERSRALMKLCGTAITRRREGIGSYRKKLEVALADLSKPIVVVLDDLDRLTSAEIRDIFKLVRLTASFPNVIYVLAFDRKRVESALGEEGVPGRAYLEKILQLVVDVPGIRPKTLDDQFAAAVNAALEDLDVSRFDEVRWPDVYAEVVKPLLRNMRDVRRYAMAIRGTMLELGRDIEAVDVLGLEAVRVFLPDVFAGLPDSAVALTLATSAFGRDEPRPQIAAAIAQFVDAAGDQQNTARAVIRRLFPAAERHIGGSSYGTDFIPIWLRERRVAHEDVLRTYIERIVGDAITDAAMAEEATALITDPTALATYVDAIDAGRLEDVLVAVSSHDGFGSPDSVIPAVVLILNKMKIVPRRDRGMFGLDSLTRLRLSAFRVFETLVEGDRLDALHQILPNLNSFTARLAVLERVGYRDGRGHKLISEEDSRALDRAWRASVRAASAHELLSEPDLLRVLYIATHDADPDEPHLALPPSPELTAAVLRSARTDVRSQSDGDRGVHVSPRLMWDALVAVFGNESLLLERIDPAIGYLDDEIRSVVERYVSGWRPTIHDDD